jgi:RHS repeat-associated protein
MYYYGYRFYDPVLQRWLNRDPLGEPGYEVALGAWPAKAIHVLPLGELIEDINLYRCVNNDQIDNVDTDGRGIWNSTKKNILGPTVQCLKDSWGKISTVVGAACLVAPFTMATSRCRRPCMDGTTITRQ